MRSLPHPAAVPARKSAPAKGTWAGGAYRLPGLTPVDTPTRCFFPWRHMLPSHCRTIKTERWEFASGRARVNAVAADPAHQACVSRLQAPTSPHEALLICGTLPTHYA